MSGTPTPSPAEEDEGDDPPSQAEVNAERRLDEIESAEPVNGPPEGSDPFDGDEDADEVDIDLAETNIGEEVDDGEGDSPFDGTESSSVGSDSEGAFDGASARDGPPQDRAGDMMDAADEMGDGEIAATINEGASRLAVVGLEDEFSHNGEIKTKESLREEMQEVFETFKLGEYSEDVAHEYLDMGGDVDPMTGLAVSLLLCTVLTVQMRPDGDEIISKARDTVNL